MPTLRALGAALGAQPNLYAERCARSHASLPASSTATRCFWFSVFGSPVGSLLVIGLAALPSAPLVSLSVRSCCSAQLLRAALSLLGSQLVAGGAQRVSLVASADLWCDSTARLRLLVLGSQC